MTKSRIINFLDGSQWKLFRYEHGYLACLRLIGPKGLFKHKWVFHKSSDFGFLALERAWDVAS